MYVLQKYLLYLDEVMFTENAGEERKWQKNISRNAISLLKSDRQHNSRQDDRQPDRVNMKEKLNFKTLKKRN